MQPAEFILDLGGIALFANKISASIPGSKKAGNFVSGSIF